MPVNQQLINELKVQFNAGIYWRSTTIDYYFRDTNNPPSQFSYLPDDGVPGFSAFNDLARSYFREAVGYFERIFNLDFRESAGQSGNIEIGSHRMIVGVGAYAQYPSNDHSRLMIKSDDLSSASINLPGRFVYGAIIHEMGHVLGLPHPASGSTGHATSMWYLGQGEEQISFGMHDIAVLQERYGAVVDNTNNAYIVTAVPIGVRNVLDGDSINLVGDFCLWDGGGYNSIDLSRNTNRSYLDMRPGEFSIIGKANALNNATADQNFSIAFNTRVNVAIGSSSSDRIVGNDLPNNIGGGASDDTIDGGNGQDYLRGDDGADSITGGADFDDINGNMGNDTGRGGEGGDWVVGGRDNDVLFGETGDDICYGNLGDDTCDGGVGDDLIRGGQQNDSLTGGAGADFISGDRDNDTMAGGAGADTFHTFGLAGIDRILDFNRAEGDRILVTEGGTWTVAQTGADVVVTLSGGAVVTLVGVSMASLTGDWIVGT